VKVLLDEMYPARLAEGLQAVGIEATTVAALGLAGSTDTDVFAAAVAGEYALLTENVSDFARIVADHSTAGRHHPGLLIALSSRFTRRPAGAKQLVDAIEAIVDEDVADRVVYLRPVGT
jgi:hypothetical protein